MKIIVCGAGKVGYSISQYLVRDNHDVTVLDHEQDLIDGINENLDAKGVVGYGSHPDLLDQVGAASADMIIAVTQFDEVNMVACQIAHSLFNVPQKIARIRHQPYLSPVWANLFSRMHMPIDEIISPEIEVAKAIGQRLSVPGTYNVIPFANGKVHLIGVVCDEDCPIVNTPLWQLSRLFPDLSVDIMAIVRGAKRFIPETDDQMLVGDTVYFVADTKHIARVLMAFGHEEPEAQRIIIMGGGHIGVNLGKYIKKYLSDISVSMIEVDKENALAASEALPQMMVLEGDGLNNEILEESGIRDVDAFVTVTNDDEANILGCLLAQQMGCKRTIGLVNKNVYGSLVSKLGINATVNPNAITVSSILRHVRRGFSVSVPNLLDGFAEVIETRADDNTRIINVPLKDLDLPKDLHIGIIIRGESILVPRPETVIKPNDLVVILARQGMMREVTGMFRGVHGMS